MDRLMKKWETAKDYVNAPQLYQEKNISKIGLIFFGTSQFSSEEAMDILRSQNIQTDAMRLKAFPFNRAVEDFINAHEQIFVIEQNRDAQMRSLIMIELGINADKLFSVLNYDGMPITADQITRQITSHLNLPNN
jgi:2-oxoglutarate ferredoxin oxidoreductase subunit alpha